MTLEHEFEREAHKSAKVLRSFWKMIPRSAILDAEGVAVVRVYKVGLHGVSARGGGGCMVSRLSDRRWSPPILISMGGLGVGLQLGIEKINLVFILRTKAAVRSFISTSVTLGGALSVAAGPVGRNAEGGGTSTGAAIWSYSQTKGLYLGISLESSVLYVSKDNENFYHAPVSRVINGEVGDQRFAKELYDALDLSYFLTDVSVPVHFYNSDSTQHHSDSPHHSSNSPSHQASHDQYPQPQAYQYPDPPIQASTQYYSAQAYPQHPPPPHPGGQGYGTYEGQGYGTPYQQPPLR